MKTKRSYAGYFHPIVALRNPGQRSVERLILTDACDVMHLSSIAGSWFAIPIRVTIVVLLRIALRISARLRISLRSGRACCDTRTALICTHR